MHASQGYSGRQPEPHEIICHRSAESLAGNSSGQDLRYRNPPQSQALSFPTEQSLITRPELKHAIMFVRGKTNAVLKNKAVNSTTFVISDTARQIILRSTVIPFSFRNIIAA